MGAGGVLGSRLAVSGSAVPKKCGGIGRGALVSLWVACWPCAQAEARSVRRGVWVVWLQGGDWWGAVAGLRAGASVALGARPARGSGPTGVTRVWCWICVGERLYRPGCAPHTGPWTVAVAWACDLDADAQRARREAGRGRRGTALGGRSGTPGRARRPRSAGWCSTGRQPDATVGRRRCTTTEPRDGVSPAKSPGSGFGGRRGSRTVIATERASLAESLVSPRFEPYVA